MKRKPETIEDFRKEFNIDLIRDDDECNEFRTAIVNLLANIKEREAREKKYETELEKIRKKHERVANPESVADVMAEVSGGYDEYRNTTDQLCEVVHIMVTTVREYESLKQGTAAGGVT